MNIYDWEHIDSPSPQISLWEPLRYNVWKAHQTLMVGMELKDDEQGAPQPTLLEGSLRLCYPDQVDRGILSPVGQPHGCLHILADGQHPLSVFWTTHLQLLLPSSRTSEEQRRSLQGAAPCGRSLLHHSPHFRYSLVTIARLRRKYFLLSFFFPLILEQNINLWMGF